ncbi:hypothetical protein J31TS4_20610 [Paenibacillus sp. J31TS4]|uniref:adenosylcobinamide-phosphate synthase CbiB n=1 Tax=Paenibacillus sp. J31TS4 TaxID=2807195 RepID=UPI001B027A9D|nr:adenosylcobinamide-phosphate synthase CbiB [Paenibacillus sp. J31TS4]GIP38781.1 hypothetical protein J31TS4_20610 [Paenibacillus sp. J31TS4]
MLLFTWEETLWMALAAIVLDRLIGDPPWPTHPVILMGRLIKRLEALLRRGEQAAQGGALLAGEAADNAEPEAGLAATGQKEPREKAGADTAGEVQRANAAQRQEAAAAKRTQAAAGESAAGQAAQRDAARSGAAGTGVPSPGQLRWKGALLATVTVTASAACAFLLVWAARWLHPCLGYAVNTWLIAATIAIKGLKDAAMQVYRPLASGDLAEARRYTGYIVGRETARLEERELTRATVETVAENTVDAVVSPLVFALLGGAPLAMAYRAVNTLDSMVGYRNDRYLYFGWASARLDDVLNWVPARLTGLLLPLAALLTPPASAKRALASVRRFARLHPSPNSGFPEAAVAGALGIELGGRNVYGGRVSERARMGWPLEELQRGHIVQTVRLLVRVSHLLMGGILGWLILLAIR